MKKLLLLTLLLAATPVAPAAAQYGGPPMWDRNYGNPEYRRPRYMPPWRVQRCIYSGRCNPYGRPPRY